jgi:tetratricopeptide (TPR) repeat protein
VGLAQAQRAAEAVALLEPYQTGLPDDPADDDTYRFWSDMAYALQAANQRARCAAALERAIAGGEARGDLAEVLTNLSNLSGVKGNLGRLDAALVDAQRAQRLSERLGDVAGIPAGALHIHLGLLSACSGRLGSALRHFDSAHELFVKAGQNTWVAVARNHRADVLLNLGQVARARQALPADDPALLRPTRARRLIVAARIERALGHSPLPLLTQSIAVLGDVGDPYMRLLAQIDALRAQEPAEAAEAALELEAHARRIEHLAVATKARWYRADALRRAGRIDDALALVRLARADFASTQPWDMYIAETWSIERRAALDAGDADAARGALRAALAWIEVALGDVPDEFRDSFRHRNPINDALLAARGAA